MHYFVRRLSIFLLLTLALLSSSMLWATTTVNIPMFTVAEREYLDSKPVLKTAYSSSWEPVEFRDNISGQYSGISKVVLNFISQATGIVFDMQPQVKIDYKSSDFDVFSAVINDTNWALENSMQLSYPYIDLQMVKVSGKGNPAIVAERDGLPGYSLTDVSGEIEQIRYYSSFTECLDALLRGEAGVTYIDMDSAVSCLSNARFSSLTDVDAIDWPFYLCLGISSHADPRLLSIIDKVIQAMPTTLINEYMISYEHGRIDSAVQDRISNDSGLKLKVITYIGLFSLLAGFCAWLFCTIVYKNSFKKVAYKDELTGILNAAGFRKSVSNSLLQDLKGDKWYIISFDFLSFNEFGKVFGKTRTDELIRNTASLMVQEKAEHEIVAHDSEDRFYMLYKARSSSELELRLNEFESKLRKLRQETSISLRFGVYEVQNKENHVVRDMCNYATMACRLRETTSASNLNFFKEEMHNRFADDNELVAYMSTALSNGEFVAYYQPKYEISTGDIIGAEALCRWNHPTRGFLGPDKFIHLFEMNGLIQKLDFYILNEVCKYLSRCVAQGTPIVPISVNFSRANLLDENLAPKIIQLVDSYRLNHELVEIEVIESSLTASGDEKASGNMNTLNILRQSGFSISIDDFGSGLSSLGFLLKIPANVVKLDRSFLEENGISEVGMRVMESIYYILIRLGKTTIAEGVTNNTQLAFLKSCGCYAVQGFLFSEPKPLQEFEEMLTRFVCHMPAKNNPQHIQNDISYSFSITDIHLLIMAQRRFSDACFSVNLSQNTYNLLDCSELLACPERSGRYSNLFQKLIILMKSQSGFLFEAFSPDNLMKFRRIGRNEYTISSDFLCPDGYFRQIEVTYVFVDNPLNNDVIMLLLLKIKDKNTRIEACPVAIRAWESEATDISLVINKSRGFYSALFKRPETMGIPLDGFFVRLFSFAAKQIIPEKGVEQAKKYSDLTKVEADLETNGELNFPIIFENSEKQRMNKIISFRSLPELPDGIFMTISHD